MTKHTAPDNLPAPDDYQQPADSPAAFQALANATQAGLERKVNRAGDTVTGRLEVQGGVMLHTPGYAAAIMDASIVDGRMTLRALDQEYRDWAPIGAADGTDPSHVVTVRQLRSMSAATVPGWSPGPASPGTNAAAVWDVGDMAPGEVKTFNAPVQPGTFVFISVQHPSTYLFAVANLTSDTNCQFVIRNGTVSTPLTNVKCHVLFVNPYRAPGRADEGEI